MLKFFKIWPKNEKNADSDENDLQKATSVRINYEIWKNRLELECLNFDFQISTEVFPLNQNSFQTEKNPFFKLEYLFKIECENHALTGVF